MLDVINLVPNPAVLATPSSIVVSIVKLPIGQDIERSVMDICARWARPIWKKPGALIDNSTLLNHYVTVNRRHQAETIEGSSS